LFLVYLSSYNGVICFVAKFIPNRIRAHQDKHLAKAKHKPFFISRTAYSYWNISHKNAYNGVILIFLTYIHKGEKMVKQIVIQLPTEQSTTPLQPFSLTDPSTEKLNETSNSEKTLQRTFLMNFCPKCQSVLELMHGKSAEIHCRKCHYRAKLANDRILKRKIDPSVANRLEIAVVDKQESKLRTFPVIQVICSKCDNNTSETWSMAIGSEGTTGVTFLRCTACGYTRREVE